MLNQLKFMLTGYPQVLALAAQIDVEGEAIHAFLPHLRAPRQTFCHQSLLNA
jgi:hypothetical protein